MRSLTAALLLTLLLAACTAAGGPDDPVDSDGAPPANGSRPAVFVIADGDAGGADGAMTVSQALGHRGGDDPVLVSGALFVNADGTILLCEAIAESFPPQCGGARLEVRGLDLATIDGVQREGDVGWAESVVLFGSVEQR
jgi:hypothetical protein